MGMTISEKILASHSGRDRVAPRDIIMAKPDLLLGNDGTVSMDVMFSQFKNPTVRDKDKIVFIGEILYIINAISANKNNA